MDGESIRNGLRDIFGDFNDLCQQISNTSGALSHRHGVVAPATPVGPRPNPFAPNNSISRPRTPPSTQSARICLQTMADLVEETPLQPLAPASFNRDLHQEPSTSSASSKTYDDATDLKRKKRKNRTNDSDSDMETRKRHAQDHSVKPSTSRGALPPPVYKDLFGDDTSKPNETSEKAISPDSGVHSNEGIDEADISQIIHVMSDLMPMLSPIMSRPYEMYRQWKEKSRKERKELQKKKREEEKERREQEEKDRRRREDLERKTTEERERREAEEKERRESEERIRREQEDEKKREEERTKKEAEERQRQREEEKQRKEEERLRKLKREEEKQRAKEAEKKKKEVEELERARLEKAEKEKEERRRIQQQEELDRQSPDSKFSGTLTLRNLSNDRLSQLLDISRKSTKLEKLEGGRSSSRPVSPFPSKLEKEDRLASEGKLESRLEAKLDVKNVPSPRSSSSKRSGDFHCAGNECIPPKPILPTKVKDGEGASPGEVYQEMAKAKKRQADIQDDKVKRILLYLECMVYFTMAAQYYIQHERNGYSHLSIIRDTATLISGVTNRFLYHDNLTPLDQHFTSRVRVLSIRAQSILGFHAFNIKMASTIKTASIIDKSDGKCHFHNADDQQPVPSPSESQNSGSNSAANIMVTMPVEVYNCYKTQLKHLHGLMNAHKLWADSASYISKSPADTLFINSLEALCGALTIMSPIDKLGIFILTAVSWLRDEQELELKRPQPPPLKEAIKKSR